MIDATRNKINAIKAVRDWTRETFGVTLGLPESKALVEQLQPFQRERIREVKFLLHGEDPQVLIDLLIMMKSQPVEE